MDKKHFHALTLKIIQILRSQKDAGKNLKMTGLVHVLVVQVTRDT